MTAYSKPENLNFNIKLPDEGVNPFALSVLEKIREDVKKKGDFVVLDGAFGDTTGCAGIIESLEYPSDGGTITKLYGCPYLFKGYPDGKIIEMIGLSKAMISLIPKETIGKFLSFRVFFVFLFIFRRKVFWHFLRTYFGAIHDLVIKKVEPREKIRYCLPARTLRNCFIQAVREKYDFEIEGNLGLETTSHYFGEREFLIVFAYIVELFCVIIEYDSAYRLRFQDIAPLLSKKDFETNPRKEINRLFDILIERERDDFLKNKWTKLRKILDAALRVKKIRELLKHFISLVALDHIKMDEHDIYFCLRRKCYYFLGLSFEDRMRRKNEIDEKNGGRFILQTQNVMSKSFYRCDSCNSIKIMKTNYINSPYFCGDCKSKDVLMIPQDGNPRPILALLNDYKDC